MNKKLTIDKVADFARSKRDLIGGFLSKDVPEHGDFLVPGPHIVMDPNTDSRVGYVVQVRIGIGAFGSNMVLLRHPCGTLVPHENNAFYKVPEGIYTEFMIDQYDGEYEKEMNYTGPYTLSGGAFPETGAIIEKPADGYIPDESPRMDITIDSGDSKTLIRV